MNKSYQLTITDELGSNRKIKEVMFRYHDNENIIIRTTETFESLTATDETINQVKISRHVLTKFLELINE